MRRDTRTACPILTYDTWKFCRILCRFQICSQKYQFHHSKKVDFFALCKFMQIRWLYSRYGFQGCGTAQGPNLPSMVLIASAVQVSWQITSTYGTLVFGPTYMRNGTRQTLWMDTFPALWTIINSVQVTCELIPSPYLRFGKIKVL